MRAQEISDPVDRKRFALAGRSKFTLESPTGTRFTFRMTKSPEEAERPPVWFVSVLCGPDNDDDYRYIGIVGADDVWRFGRKAKVSRDALSVVSFAWAWPRIAALGSLAGAKFWHEGKCGRCGRTLTVPESIASGLGPLCLSKIVGPL